MSLEASPPGELTRGRPDPLRVLAETAYPESVASARVRVANFVPFLRAHGVALTYAPTLTQADYQVVASSGRLVGKVAALGRASAAAAMRRPSEHDLLFVHRLRLLNPLPGFDPPKHVDIYDIDDPLFVNFRGGVNSRHQWAKREVLRCIEYVRRARLVFVGNRFLADRAREYTRHVEVVPSCIDPSSQPVHTHVDAGPVTVGWIGSPTTTPYLRLVLPVFARLNAERLRFKLVLVGADASVTAPWIEHHRWSAATESEHLARLDIGIMPQPDDEWARGKCGYKVLQYFAAGVPAIASPVGITPELIGTDRGVLAATADEWRRALLSLAGNPRERAERGVAARNFVEREFSYQRWAREVAGLLRSAAG